MPADTGAVECLDQFEPAGERPFAVGVADLPADRVCADHQIDLDP